MIESHWLNLFQCVNGSSYNIRSFVDNTLFHVYLLINVFLYLLCDLSMFSIETIIAEKTSDPNINGNNPVVENQALTLICYARSQSLPEEFRNQSFIEYTWSGAYGGLGSSITIGPLLRKDDGINMTCISKEQGSSDSLHVQSTVQITVFCK